MTSPVDNLRVLIALARQPLPEDLASPELVDFQAEYEFMVRAARNSVPDLEAVCEENKKMHAVLDIYQADLLAFNARAEAAESALADLRVENEKLTKTSREDHAIFQYELRVANGRTAASRGQVEAEREACARLVEGNLIDERYREWPSFGPGNRGNDSEVVQFTRNIAAAIRARVALATPEEGKK